IHEEGCKSNPQNQAKELQRSQPKRPRTPPPKVMDTESEEHESKDRRRGSSYADAVKGLIFGSSALQSKEAQTGNQPQREDGNTRQPSKEERKPTTGHSKNKPVPPKLFTCLQELRTTVSAASLYIFIAFLLCFFISFCLWCYMLFMNTLNFVAFKWV
ncbi:hypothetical protein V5799_011344, partial [Amblyomma americanum]